MNINASPNNESATAAPAGAGLEIVAVNIASTSTSPFSDAADVDVGNQGDDTFDAEAPSASGDHDKCYSYTSNPNPTNQPFICVSRSSCKSILGGASAGLFLFALAAGSMGAVQHNRMASNSAAVVPSASAKSSKAPKTSKVTATSTKSSKTSGDGGIDDDVIDVCDICSGGEIAGSDTCAAAREPSCIVNGLDDPIACHEAFGAPCLDSAGKRFASVNFDYDASEVARYISTYGYLGFNILFGACPLICNKCVDGYVPAGSPRGAELSRLGLSEETVTEPELELTCHCFYENSDPTYEYCFDDECLSVVSFETDSEDGIVTVDVNLDDLISSVSTCDGNGGTGEIKTGLATFEIENSCNGQQFYCFKLKDGGD